MTKNQKISYLKKELKKWTEMLYMSNWEISIYLLDNDADGIYMTVNPSPVYKKASIKVRPLFWKESENMKQQIIVHELLHCLIEPLAVISNDLLKGNLHTSWQINDSVENIVQHLATIISPLKDRLYVCKENNI